MLAWFTNFSHLLSTFGFTSCAIDRIVLTKKTKGGLVMLEIYIDDIFLIGSDDNSIRTIKTYL